MIFLFTDFGLEGPYLGQVRAVLARWAPDVPVIDLISDLPPFRPRGAAYLLAALAPYQPEGSVFLCVVDPGVGGTRPAEAACIDGRWYVGPGNGLFEIVARRAATIDGSVLDPPGRTVSASFHGRDLFAPAAARIATGHRPDVKPGFPTRFPTWPDDLAEVVYIDRFGNLMTGLRARGLAAGTRLVVSGSEAERARTFSDVPRGRAFWYENANGLAEIAVNQGHAARMFHAEIGDSVGVVS